MCEHLEQLDILEDNLDKKLIFHGRAPEFINIYKGDMPCCGEPGGGESLVEVAGYIEKVDQLRFLMESGRHLENYRIRMAEMMHRDPEEQRRDYEDPESQVYQPHSRKDYEFDDAERDLSFYLESYSEKLKQAQEAYNIALKAQKEKESAKFTSPAVDGGQEGAGMDKQVSND